MAFKRRSILRAISSSSGDKAVMMGSILPVCKLGTLKRSLRMMLASMRPPQENKWIKLKQKQKHF